MANLGEGIIRALLSGGETYLANKEKQKLLAQQMAEKAAEKKESAAERALKGRLGLAGKYDIAKSGEGGFEAGKYFPELQYPEGTELKRTTPPPDILTRILMLNYPELFNRQLGGGSPSIPATPPPPAGFE